MCTLEITQILLKQFLMRCQWTPVYKLRKIIKYKAKFHLYNVVFQHPVALCRSDLGVSAPYMFADYVTETNCQKMSLDVGYNISWKGRNVLHLALLGFKNIGNISNKLYIYKMELSTNRIYISNELLL
jgi:hypothetical protein